MLFDIKLPLITAFIHFLIPSMWYICTRHSAKCKSHHRQEDENVPLWLNWKRIPPQTVKIYIDFYPESLVITEPCDKANPHKLSHMLSVEKSSLIFFMPYITFFTVSHTQDDSLKRNLSVFRSWANGKEKYLYTQYFINNDLAFWFSQDDFPFELPPNERSI